MRGEKERILGRKGKTRLKSKETKKRKNNKPIQKD